MVFLISYHSYLDNILRIWDYVAAQRPDYIVANSEETQRRIYKFYRKYSQVIYPPVEIGYKKSEQKPNLDKRTITAQFKFTAKNCVYN